MLKKIQNLLYSSTDAREMTVNSFWSFAGTLFSKGLSFLGWVLVARILGKELNGQIGMIRSTINLFLIFVGSGLGITATKYISQYYALKNYQKAGKILSLALWSSLVFSIIICISLYFFSDQIAQTLNKSGLSDTLRIGAFILFFAAINSALKGCLEGFKLFKKSAIVSILYSIVLFIGLYLGAESGVVDSTFTGFLMANLFYTVLQLYLVFKEIQVKKLKLTLNLKPELKLLFTFTLPAMLSGAMVIPFKWYSETILVNQPRGYEEMGLFSAIILFQALLYMLAQTLNAPLVTLMTKSEKNHFIDRLSLLLPWALGVFGALPFLFFPELFGLIFGREYVSSDHFHVTYTIVLFVTVIVLFKQGIARIMVVKNLMWLSFLDNLIWGVSLITLFYFLKGYGAKGLAISYLIAYVINTLIIIPLYLKWKLIPKHIVSSPAALLSWGLLLIIGVALLYYPMHWAIRIITVILSFGIFSGLFYKLYTTHSPE